MSMARKPLEKGLSRGLSPKYLHQYQDTYVHYENGYILLTLGHAFALTNPDNDDEAWENASQATQGFVNGWNNACKLKCPSNCEAGWERR